MFSCEFFEVLKNDFFYRALPVATSVFWLSFLVKLITNFIRIPGAKFLYEEVF